MYDQDVFYNEFHNVIERVIEYYVVKNVVSKFKK